MEEDTYFETDESEDLQDIILETKLEQNDRICKKVFDTTKQKEDDNVQLVYVNQRNEE